MSKNYSSNRDVTDKQATGGGGMSMAQMFVQCGHKSSSTGATFRSVPSLGRVAWRCAACNVKAKA